MSQILAFANQKGGVGKTTSCVNLAAGLYLSGQRVLVCDLDPQGNATMGSGIDKNTLKGSMNEVLQAHMSAYECIVKKTPAGYDLIGANSDLTQAEVIMVKKQTRAKFLKESLEVLKSQYDFILLDCPPSLSMLTVNALVASEAIIIAIQCEYFALEGLTDLLNTITQLRQPSLNPGLHIGGIVRTMYDGRNRLTLEVSKQLMEHFGNRVFQTVIPRNVRIAEAPSHGLPAVLYDKSCSGSKAYMALTNELKTRYEVKQKTLNTASRIKSTLIKEHDKI